MIPNEFLFPFTIIFIGFVSELKMEHSITEMDLQRNEGAIGMRTFRISISSQSWYKSLCNVFICQLSNQNESNSFITVPSFHRHWPSHLWKFYPIYRGKFADRQFHFQIQECSIQATFAEEDDNVKQNLDFCRREFDVVIA